MNHSKKSGHTFIKSNNVALRKSLKKIIDFSHNFLSAHCVCASQKSFIASELLQRLCDFIFNKKISQIRFSRVAGWFRRPENCKKEIIDQSELFYEFFHASSSEILSFFKAYLRSFCRSCSTQCVWFHSFKSLKCELACDHEISQKNSAHHRSHVLTSFCINFPQKFFLTLSTPSLVFGVKSSSFT